MSCVANGGYPQRRLFQIHCSGASRIQASNCFCISAVIHLTSSAGVGGARHFELLDLDLEAALLADAQAARHPDAGADAPGDHGRNGRPILRACRKRARAAPAVVQVADDAEAAALAHEVHDAARGVLPLLAVAPLAEQAARIEVAAQLAQVGVDVGVLDGAIDGGGVVAGERERPDRQLPIAHVQGHADGGAELVRDSGVKCSR